MNQYKGSGRTFLLHYHLAEVCVCRKREREGERERERSELPLDNKPTLSITVLMHA
jgi:hypothetical protein